MIKAVICDLDRTLLHIDKSVSAYTLDVLRRCRERGVRVIAASARPERTIREFGLGDVFEAMVTLNGARVLLPEGERVNAIPPETGETVIARLMDIPDMLLSVETSAGIYANAPIPEWNAAVFDGFPKLPKAILHKILVSGVTESQVRAALTPDTYHTAIEGGKLYQVMSREATKWNGVREILAAFHIDSSETAYFGDDWDDLECVRNCGVGVAVANAIDEVKRAADLIIGHCDTDAVAKFIEEKVL